MNETQIRALFKGYLYLLQRNGHCEANLPQSDFLLMREFVKKCNYTTSEGNADNVLNVHIDGKTIKIGGY